MQINSKMTGTSGPETAHSAPTADAADRATVGSIGPTASSADRTEKAQVLDSALALSASEGDSMDRSLEPARAAEVRSRILGGAYNTIEVVDAVARRLLMSGDL